MYEIHQLASFCLCLFAIHALFHILQPVSVCTIEDPMVVAGMHRRRIELEDKEKVMASVWGTDSLPRYLFCLGQFGSNG